MNKPKLEKYKAIGGMDKWICYDGRVSCTGHTPEEAYQGYCNRKGQGVKLTGIPITTSSTTMNKNSMRRYRKNCTV